MKPSFRMSTRSRGGLLMCSLAILSVTGCEGLVPPVDGGPDPVTPTTFLVRIENISTIGTLVTTNGDMPAVPVSPGVYLVHNQAAPIFNAGQADRGDGLEGIAEDGMPATLAGNLQGAQGVSSNGVFDTPVGANAPGGIGPGGAYEFEVMGVPGDYLSFAAMFVPSNDAFFSPDEMGIDLFDADGNPTNGDVTAQVDLWDAGTEVNQEPGAGPDSAPMQAGENTGADENGIVQLIADSGDGFTYPATTDVIRVTITPQ
ncbi:MAG: hypothetical protein GXP29_15100 [Planctomycetes bacterium]|nr:hypothetical protein [Planctomycetota bacterium]